MAIVKPEYWVNLQGRPYPKYEGVLVAAHEEGLLGISVRVLQYPSPENGHMAVCTATVTMKGDGETPQEYTEIGDASPENVGPAIRKHILRMSATRAKGRALRDAIALGVALVEELGGDDDSPPTLPRDDGPVRRISSPPAGAPPAAPLPVARHAPGPVGQPSAPRSETPRPVVVAEGGAPVCELCGVVLTTAQMQISEKHFSGRRLCPNDQRNERVALGIRAQSTEAPA